MNSAQHLHLSGTQTQASTVLGHERLLAAGWVHPALCNIQPLKGLPGQDLHSSARCAAEEVSQKDLASRGATAPGSQRKNGLMNNSHCTKEKDSIEESLLWPSVWLCCNRQVLLYAGCRRASP